MLNGVRQIEKPVEVMGIAQQFKLSWSHYLILMRIKNDDERSFYEMECRRQDWSAHQLKRQYNLNFYKLNSLNVIFEHLSF